MTNESLLYMMSDIDPKLISRAEAPVPIYAKRNFKITLLVAMLSLLIAVSLLLTGSFSVLEYVRVNYPEHDGTTLHLLQILLTEDENPITSLMDDATKQAISDFFEALRNGNGDNQDSTGEIITEEPTEKETEEPTRQETEEPTEQETDPDTDTPPAQGWSEGLEYTQETQDGKTVYVVSGMGKCTDDEVYISPTYKGCDVVAIGEKAFIENLDLRAVTLPSTVREIRTSAFRKCYNLRKVTLTAGLVEIGEAAFSVTTDLEQITLPDTVEIIGEKAFMSSSLIQIVIPDSVYQMGRNAFQDCKYMESVTLPNRLAIIPNQAFAYNTSLRSVIIPYNVSQIGDYAFFGCSALEYVEFPNKSISVGMHAFSGCGTEAENFSVNCKVATTFGSYAFEGSGLKTFVFPEGTYSVLPGMFYDCTYLKSVTLPDSITAIGDQAFDLCPRLNEIHYQGTPEEWEKIDMSKKYRERLALYVEYDSK